MFKCCKSSSDRQQARSGIHCNKKTQTKRPRFPPLCCRCLPKLDGRPRPDILDECSKINRATCLATQQSICLAGLALPRCRTTRNLPCYLCAGHRAMTAFLRRNLRLPCTAIFPTRQPGHTPGHKHPHLRTILPTSFIQNITTLRIVNNLDEKVFGIATAPTVLPDRCPRSNRPSIPPSPPHVPLPETPQRATK